MLCLSFKILSSSRLSFVECAIRLLSAFGEPLFLKLSFTASLLKRSEVLSRYGCGTTVPLTNHPLWYFLLQWLHNRRKWSDNRSLTMCARPKNALKTFFGLAHKPWAADAGRWNWVIFSKIWLFGTEFTYFWKTKAFYSLGLGWKSIWQPCTCWFFQQPWAAGASR